MKPSTTSRGALDEPSRAPRVRLGAWVKRLILGLSFGAALVWIAFWTLDEGPNPPSSTNRAPLEVRNLRSLLVRDAQGRPLWQIAADSVQISPEGSLTTFRGVSRGVLFRNGAGFLTMNARLVRVSSTRDLDASGGVRAQGPNGFSFQTPRARWWNRAQRVDCPEPVQATLQGLHFQSPQLRYQWNTGQLSCSKPVEVKGNGVSLRGNRLNVDIGKRVVKLSGGAELVFDPRAANPKSLGAALPR